MLMEIRSYLQQHRSASIVDLSNHFRIAPDALRGMLEHWLRKGTVVQRDFTPDCNGCGTGHCGGCGVLDAFEIYELCAETTTAE